MLTLNEPQLWMLIILMAVTVVFAGAALVTACVAFGRLKFLESRYNVMRDRQARTDKAMQTMLDLRTRYDEMMRDVQDIANAAKHGGMNANLQRQFADKWGHMATDTPSIEGALGMRR